ncbi:flavohemoglobin expression-modulating QEGLA motif protein [Nonlabens xiamenensis]|uniref:flavohemoglobin expression-modulating QEGLA motif protein n=1 Tax=Nonlabens xiamenensis TaxID=2341043 RepID=UPI000F615427|nr:tyrosine/phenylalanine carboxypeptidase domain-containing protein [Nonlabens xiamenensis]
MPQFNIQQEYKSLFEIDANIHRFVRNLELLAFINPLNIAQERKQFFREKFNYEPQFKYRKVKFNPYKLHRLFYSQRLERIEDETIKSLYKDIIYTYSGLVQCIETIAEPNSKFYFNSLRFFGTPTEKMVENARFILHFDEDDLDNEKFEPRLTTAEAEAFFKNYRRQYNFDFAIKTSSAMSASAMVSNNDRSLILKKNHKFSQHDLNVLAHHEIGVHLVTTFNAVEQPLHIFSNGFPNNVETQEGLAVMSEYMSGSLTMTRLKELAYRVIATDSLIKGYSFADTFDLIHNQYKMDQNRAFNITLRIHRGGGFTKDALYLSGLKKVYDNYQNNQSLDEIFLGKCSLEYREVVSHMKKLGIAQPAKHRSLSFDHCLNKDSRVEFVLNHLK